MKKLILVLSGLLLLAVTVFAEPQAKGVEHNYTFEHYTAGGVAQMILLDTKTGNAWSYVQASDKAVFYFKYIPREDPKSFDKWVNELSVEQQSEEKKDSFVPDKPYRDLRDSSK